MVQTLSARALRPTVSLVVLRELVPDIRFFYRSFADISLNLDCKDRDSMSCHECQLTLNS